MKRAVTLVVLLIALVACRAKPNGAVVVYQDHVQILGQARVEFNLAGGASIDPWQPRNIAIFRTTTTMTSQSGRSFSGTAGKVYWINDKYGLEPIGDADPAADDKTVARRYGVKVSDK